jgi:ABC-type multidrug transport system permease subunit
VTSSSAVAPPSLRDAVCKQLISVTFDYQAPGLIVFALLLQVSSVLIDLARETDRGTLATLKLSNMRSFDLIFGTMLTWIVIAVVQILLLFGVAVTLGFKRPGGANCTAEQVRR